MHKILRLAFKECILVQDVVFYFKYKLKQGKSSVSELRQNTSVFKIQSMKTMKSCFKNY